MFKKIDVDKWNRKATSNFFKDFEDPFFNLTMILDVTAIYRLCKENKLSFLIAVSSIVSPLTAEFCHLMSAHIFGGM